MTPLSLGYQLSIVDLRIPHRWASSRLLQVSGLHGEVIFVRISYANICIKAFSCCLYSAFKYEELKSQMCSSEY